MTKEYIEREAVVNLREEFWKDRCDHMAVRVTNIMNLPAADVVPIVHAYWEEYWDDNYLSWCHKCSNCGNFPLTKEETMHDEVLSDFCPYCGARMDGGNSNDNQI